MILRQQCQHSVFFKSTTLEHLHEETVLDCLLQLYSKARARTQLIGKHMCYASKWRTYAFHRLIVRTENEFEKKNSLAHSKCVWQSTYCAKG
jgi:hypothetical protein